MKNNLLKIFLKIYLDKGLLKTLLHIKSAIAKRIKKLYYKLSMKKSFRSKYDFYMFLNWYDVNSEWCFFDLYGETGHAKFISKINYPFLFLDIGANLGYYSLLANKNPYCQKIICFEPVHNTFLSLKRNLELNNINQKKYSLHNYAISNKTENTKIYYNSKHSGSASLLHSGNNNEIIEISSVNHSFLNKIDNKDIKIVIKIDTEGYEEIVIKEILKSNLLSDIEVLIYEHHEEFNNDELINNLLKKSKFKKFTKLKYNNNSFFDYVVEK